MNGKDLTVTEEQFIVLVGKLKEQEKKITMKQEAKNNLVIDSWMTIQNYYIKKKNYEQAYQKQLSKYENFKALIESFEQAEVEIRKLQQWKYDIMQSCWASVPTFYKHKKSLGL